MNLPTMPQLAREQAKFTHYEDGKLWYQVIYTYEVAAISEFGHAYEKQTVGLFDFPIPVDDAGGGKFLPVDRAITFMRWMRKHLAMLTAATQEPVT